MTTRLFTGLVSLALLAAACSSAVDDIAVVDPDDLTTDLTVVLNAQVYTVDDQSPWASLFDLRDTAESPLAVLDRAVPDRPAIVLDNLGHAVWTNSAGLELAGIAADASDPQGGAFHRDRDGNLTGLLLEDAQQLVRNASAPDDQANYEGLLAALAELAAHGVTTVSDAGGYWA